MSRNVLIVGVLALSFLVQLSGCGEQAREPSPPPPQKAAVPKVKKVEPVPPPEAVPEPAVPEYRYDPVGRRDPFESLLTVKKPVSSVSVPLTPLQKFDVGQLRLIGMIIGKGEPRAMVIAPDGKSYILKKGVKVGRQDGTVIDINQDAVLVEERYVDFSGEVRTGIQEIALPEQEGVE